MTWARFDDAYYDHPKLAGLSVAALARHGGHARLTTYSARHLTDGIVVLEAALQLVPINVLHGLEERGAVRLTDASLEVNDYLDYNPSKATIMARRQAESDAGRRGARKRWAKT